MNETTQTRLVLLLCAAVALLWLWVALFSPAPNPEFQAAIEHVDTGPSVFAHPAVLAATLGGGLVAALIGHFVRPTPETHE